MTSEALAAEIVKVVLIPMADRLARVLENLSTMHHEAAPPGQIVAYLNLEGQQLQHWIDHELAGQVRAALQGSDVS